jgi:hypothetical protein
MTRQAAEREADTIREFWSSKGISVEVWLERRAVPRPCGDGKSEYMWVVCSNLSGGLPPGTHPAKVSRQAASFFAASSVLRNKNG